jgi:hypothetical protein
MIEVWHLGLMNVVDMAQEDIRRYRQAHPKKEQYHQQKRDDTYHLKDHHHIAKEQEAEKGRLMNPMIQVVGGVVIESDRHHIAVALGKDMRGDEDQNHHQHHPASIVVDPVHHHHAIIGLHHRHHAEHHHVHRRLHYSPKLCR